MSTQLDPVTGAPLLTPDLGNIDQLPYSVQPVPLADQTNQPQLGRTYLYPDDVPPVLANLNAMNGTQPDQAQTLHTDGSHRLLVASSGGGGGPIILPAHGMDGQRVQLEGTDSNSVTYQAVAYIISVSMYVAITGIVGLTDGQYGYSSVDMTFDNGEAFATLAVSGYRDGTKVVGQTSVCSTYSPPYPIDISANVPGWPTIWNINIASNGPFELSVEVYLIAGSPL